MLQIIVLTLAAISSLTQAAPYYDYSYDDCVFSDGTTARNGDIFQIPGYGDCFKFRCVRGNSQVVEEGCSSDGRCYSVGATFEKGCLTYRCSKSVRNGVNWYSTDVVQERCSHDGKCYDIGSTFDVDCLTYRCSKSVRGGYTWYTKDIVRARCQDINGVCRGPGEVFRYNLRGQVFDRCRCSITSHRSVYYSCEGYSG